MRKKKVLWLLVGMLLMLVSAGCGNKNEKMTEETEVAQTEETGKDLPGQTEETSENLTVEEETEKVDSVAAEEVEIVEETVPSLNRGDSISFGKYEQDNNLENGVEDIEWTVIGIQEDTALLLSNKILCAADFNSEKVDSEGNLCWGNSSLCEWMNSEFYEQAFSEEEKGKIRPMHIVGGGIESVDNVFLLSRMEYKRFAGNYREAGPSRYAYNQGLEISAHQKCSYWLRTVAELEDYYTVKMIDMVDWDGELGNKPIMDSKQYGVRPAIWISLTESNKEPIDSPFMEEESYIKKSEYVTERTELEIGEKVIFGMHVDTPMEWWVVDAEDDGYILLGANADSWYWGNSAWSKDDIQSWLDEDKYFEWFNALEQDMIITQTDSEGNSRDLIYVTKEESKIYRDIAGTTEKNVKIKVAFE